MKKGMQLNVVSAEATLFSGAVVSATATGKLGELGIYPGHTALLTELKPGEFYVEDTEGAVSSFYLSGGILEVQPAKVTVLADVAMRAESLDEAAADLARQQAEETLSRHKSGIEYDQALTELAEAVAQLRIIKKLRAK